MAHSNAWSDNPLLGSDIGDTIDNKVSQLALDINQRLSIDHKMASGTATGIAQDGLHNKVTMPNTTSVSAGLADRGILHVEDASSKAELFYMDEDSNDVQLTSGGKLGVAGQAIVGTLTGNVTGNVTGDVTGNVTGNLTGNVTGNVTGNADTATTATTATTAGSCTGNSATATVATTASKVSRNGGTTSGLLLRNYTFSSTNAISHALLTGAVLGQCGAEFTSVGGSGRVTIFDSGSAYYFYDSAGTLVACSGTLLYWSSA